MDIEALKLVLDRLSIRIAATEAATFALAEVIAADPQAKPAIRTALVRNVEQVQSTLLSLPGPQGAEDLRMQVLAETLGKYWAVLE